MNTWNPFVRTFFLNITSNEGRIRKSIKKLNNCILYFILFLLKISFSIICSFKGVSQHVIY